MTLSYNGAPFHGWQNQPNAVSVQSTIEDALGKLLRRPTPLAGAGRTDAGVNARRMVAHFDMDEPLAGEAGVAVFVRRLNAIVGRDIVIESLRPVAPDAHARFDATRRTYHYFVHTMKSAFNNSFSWQAPPNLDFEAMNRAAKNLLGTRDFTSFAKLHTDVKTNICTVVEAEWRPLGDNRWEFVISADRFLRNMVRAVVGTLIEVGRGKIDEAKFIDIINDKDRCSAGTSMPGHALFLWDVEYPAAIYG